MPLRDEIPQRIIFRRHPALLQAVFLVIGLLCGYRYPTFYSPVFILLGAISLFLLTYLSSLAFRRVTPLLRHIALGCTTFALGFILAQVDYSQLDRTPTPRKNVCTIAHGTPRRTDRGYWRVEVSPLHEGAERNLLVYLPPSEAAPIISYGDTLYLYPTEGHILSSTPLRTIENLSYRHYLVARGAYATLYPRSYQVVLRSRHTGLREWAEDLRLSLVRTFEQLHLSPEEADLIRTISLGMRDGSSGVDTPFRNAGAAHLLSVSGFHLVVVLGLFAFLIPPTRHRRGRIARGLFLIMIAWLFAFLTGLSAPTVRAATMYTLYSVGVLLLLPQDKLNTLALSAILLLLYHPGYVFDVGFQFSYAALLSILLYEPFFALYARRLSHPLARYIYLSLSVCLSAQILTLPLVLYHFGSSSTLFLWSNLPLMLLATLLIPLALLYAILASLGVVFPLLSQGVEALTHGLYQAASLFDSVEGGVFSLRLSGAEALGLTAFLLGMYGILTYIVTRYKSVRLAAGYTGTDPFEEAKRKAKGSMNG